MKQFDIFVFKFFWNCQVIKGRYEAKGDKHETDEFLKPIIVDPEGRIKGLCFSITVMKLLAFEHEESHPPFNC